MPATRPLPVLLALAIAMAACHSALAAPPERVGACGFDRQAMQFQGTARTQAACLLRTVLPWGQVVATPAELPASLTRLVDHAMDEWKQPLRQDLAHQGLPEEAVGGSLDAPLSAAVQADGHTLPARYFVIHDTSWPWLDRQAFPADADAGLNDLGAYAHASTALAHVFVNRLGQTFAAHGFDEPWRATKLELRVLGLPAKGLFLHVELLQPRQRDPAGPAGNDALAPSPGFTPAQYDMLALLYMAASVRAGTGLVPGFHGAIDEGLDNGHDDPQHFQLAEFGAALARLEDRLAHAH